MKRLFALFLFSLCGTVVTVSAFVWSAGSLSFADVETMLGSVFFVDSVTVNGLRAKYKEAGQGGPKVRILIVPGHDNDSWGTEFNGVRESDMNAAVGEELARRLSGDMHYESILVRTKEDYVKEFREYFKNEAVAVRGFVAQKKKIMQDLIKAGMIHRASGVVHNTAPVEVVSRLYGINRWANDNGVDIVLHIHFNDYPGRNYHRPGRFNGFAIYTPEDQFSNSRASRVLAQSIFDQLSSFYAKSNFPLENSGIVPDQELIAIGAYNTLDPASLLIEYGYIYETQYLDPTIREATLKELALQTEIGLNRFFGNVTEALRRYPTTFLPHEWKQPLASGTVNHPSVLSLQAALLLENAYPPAGEDKRTCPLTGSFGPCTERAVRAFQLAQGIIPADGAVDIRTLRKLNEKYSR